MQSSLSSGRTMRFKQPNVPGTGIQVPAITSSQFSTHKLQKLSSSLSRTKMRVSSSRGIHLRPCESNVPGTQGGGGSGGGTGGLSTGPKQKPPGHVLVGAPKLLPSSNPSMGT